MLTRKHQAASTTKAARPALTPLPLPQDHWRSRWLIFWHKGAVLHRIAAIQWDEPDEMISGEGTTLCGRTGRLNMPGIFSRMGLKRCPKCCRLMGIPEGDGCPFNKGLLEAGDKSSGTRAR